MINLKDYFKWCTDVKENWQEKHVENIVQLFTKDVEYYETPKEKIKGRNNCK